MDANATGPTAVELFWTVPQPDDAGAQTADLFDWQAAMATADGLSLYETALDCQSPRSVETFLCSQFLGEAGLVAVFVVDRAFEAAHAV